MIGGKFLTSAQGVEAAAILFELNTEPKQVMRMLREADLLDACATDASAAPAEDHAQRLCLHWYGFVHAAVVAGLMVHAPNVVTVSYLRSTRYLLKGRSLSDAVCDSFVDTYFTPYMELLVLERLKECPARFFRLTLGLERMEDVPPRAAALVAGAMAMTLGAVFDKLERYDIQAE